MRLICTTLAVVSTLAFTAAAPAETIQGSYVEARSVPGASCDSNSQPSQAVLAWQIRQGAYDGEKLDGQTIVAVVTAEPSPGTNFGRTRTVFFVEGRASKSQQQALVHMARDLASAAIHDAGEVLTAKLDVRIAEGCGCGAAVIECPIAKVRTRRPTDADQALLDESKNETPLGETFSSNQTCAEQYSFAGEPARAGNAVMAFTGSFSR